MKNNKDEYVIVINNKYYFYGKKHYQIGMDINNAKKYSNIKKVKSVCNSSQLRDRFIISFKDINKYSLVDKIEYKKVERN